MSRSVASRATHFGSRPGIRFDIRKFDQQLEELYRDVGERAVHLREAGEPVERVLYDAEVDRLVKEIQNLKDAREKLESEITEIRSER